MACLTWDIMVWHTLGQISILPLILTLNVWIPLSQYKMVQSISYSCSLPFTHDVQWPCTHLDGSSIQSHQNKKNLLVWEPLACWKWLQTGSETKPELISLQTLSIKTSISRYWSKGFEKNETQIGLIAYGSLKISWYLYSLSYHTNKTSPSKKSSCISIRKFWRNRKSTTIRCWKRPRPSKVIEIQIFFISLFLKDLGQTISLTLPTQM